MTSLSNGYLQLSGLGTLICSRDKTWRHFQDLIFSDFLILMAKLAKLKQQLFFQWLCFSTGALSLHWAGSQESTEITEIAPPPKTQDIPNQSDYSFAWKLLSPLEPKWLSCFTDGLFQILREGKKNLTRRIKEKTTVATISAAPAPWQPLLCNAIPACGALLISNMW